MQANVLRDLRTRRGLSVRQLAARSGVHYTTLSRFENGLAPREAHVRALADALGVSPRTLTRGGVR